MVKPRVTTRRGPTGAQTIVEFMFPSGKGGLISFSEFNGQPVIDIYRTDDGIRVLVPQGHSASTAVVTA